MYRHFAYFAGDDDGALRCVREWAGQVPAPPRILRYLPGPVRQRALTAWTTHVSQPQPGELGLDVTHLRYPEGDFCWARFDALRRCLSFPETHYFVEIDLETGRIIANQESGRPIRPPVGRVIVDVTGTPWQARHGCLFGRLRNVQAVLGSIRQLGLPVAEAPVDLQLIPALAPVRRRQRQ